MALRVSLTTTWPDNSSAEGVSGTLRDPTTPATTPSTAISAMPTASGGTMATTITTTAAQVSANTWRAEWATSFTARARPHTSMQQP